MNIELNTVKIEGGMYCSTYWMAWAEGKWEEVTTSHHDTETEAVETCLHLAERIWGDFEVVCFNREERPEHIKLMLEGLDSSEKGAINGDVHNSTEVEA